jgi:hypothetical protein
VKKGEAMMVAMNETSWIEDNVEMVTNYLTKEFESFAIAYRADRPLTHTFTVDNGKKRFKLVIGWPILADRPLTHATIERLGKEHVAEEMRLHGEEGYHWTPSHGDTTRRGGV